MDVTERYLFDQHHDHFYSTLQYDRKGYELKNIWDSWWKDNKSKYAVAPGTVAAGNSSSSMGSSKRKLEALIGNLSAEEMAELVPRALD